MTWVLAIPKGTSLGGFTGFLDGDRILVPFFYERDAVEAVSRYPGSYTDNIPVGRLADMKEVKDD